jgi:hypothetical protein
MIVVLGSNPTTALGAGMNKIASTQTTGINNGIREAFVSTAALGGVPLADGRFALAAQPEVQSQFLDGDLAILKLLIQGSTLQAAVNPLTVPTLGLGDTFKAIDSTRQLTVGFIPAQQAALGIDAPNALWLPDAGISGLDGFSFGEVAPGRIQNPYNVRFTAGYREKDQGNVTIPAGFRTGFWGPPKNLGLTWSIPALV